MTFTGGIHFNETGHVYIEDVPGPRYVGPPEQVIDDAWDELLEGEPNAASCTLEEHGLTHVHRNDY